MSEKNISIGEAYKSGWTSFKSNFGFLVLTLAIIFGFNVVLGLAMAFSNEIVLASLLLNLINFIVGVVISIGLVKIFVAITRGEKPLLSELFSNYQLFFKFLFSSILNSLIVGVGFLLFIVPGVFWMLQFSQYQYLVVDKKKDPIEALKESAKLTKGVKWELLGFIIIAFFINMLGLAFFVVGVLLTSVVTKLAFAHVYQQLLDQENPGADQATAQVVSPAPASTPVAPTPDAKPEPTVTPKSEPSSEHMAKPDTETKPTN